MTDEDQEKKAAEGQQTMLSCAADECRVAFNRYERIYGAHPNTMTWAAYSVIGTQLQKMPPEMQIQTMTALRDAMDLKLKALKGEPPPAPPAPEPEQAEASA